MQALELAEKRDKIIAVSLVEAYDTLNTYGADPDSLESKQRVFSRVLSGYSDKQVQSAFDRYFETEKGLPEPSDIVKIIEARAVYNRPEYQVSPPEEVHPCYIDLDQKSRDEIDEALAKAKQILTVEKPKKKEANPNHFYRMPKEARDAVQKEFEEMRERIGRRE